MDWTKVKTKHYISNGLSLKEKGILVTYVCLVAHLEKIPTVADLQFTFKSKWHQIVSKFESIYGHSDIEIASKVLEDVAEVAHKRKQNRDRQKTYRKHNAHEPPLRNAIDKSREDKIYTYSKDFERFWSEYPKKKAKAAAEKAFKNIDIKNGLFEKILKAIEKQKHSDQWKKENGQFIPFPATWLNQKRWEDDTGQVTLTKSERKPSAGCTACNGSGKLPDGKICWCYQ